jgi:micrococcal nuclease
VTVCTVPATVVRVVDGDTVIVNLDLGWRVYRDVERIRVNGISAPEVRGRSRKRGLAAKAHAETLVPVGTAVVVTSEAKPTFERTVGSLEIPGVGDPRCR